MKNIPHTNNYVIKKNHLSKGLMNIAAVEFFKLMVKISVCNHKHYLIRKYIPIAFSP